MGQHLLQVGQTASSIQNLKSRLDNERQPDHHAEPFSTTLEAHVKQASKSDKQVNARHSEKEIKTEKEEHAAHAEQTKNGKTLPGEPVTDDKDVADGMVSDIGVALTQSEIMTEKDAPEKDDDTVSQAQENPLLTASSVVGTALPSLTGNDKEKLAVTAQINTGILPQQRKDMSETGQSAKAIPADGQPNFKSELRADILQAVNQKQGQQTEIKPDSVIAKDIVPNTQQVEQLVSENHKRPLPATIKGPFVLTRHADPSPTLTATAATHVSSGVGADMRSAVVTQPAFNVQPAVNSEAWGKVLSSRLVWMAKEGIQQADLRLNPANLGPVEVRMHMHHDQVNVTFYAHHSATRDALEQALPRLRENFQENGMTLADASVSDQTTQQQSQDETSSEMTAMGQAGQIRQEENRDENGTSEADISRSDGLELGVSLYA